MLYAKQLQSKPHPEYGSTLDEFKLKYPTYTLGTCHFKEAYEDETAELT